MDWKDIAGLIGLLTALLALLREIVRYDREAKARSDRKDPR
jgi:hypothetical protein